MAPQKILALVMAGGEGTRLYPLTANQAKPAVPFINGLRLIDFVLSNFVNSHIHQIYVLAQHKPQSLIEHIDNVWAPRSRHPESFIKVRLPERGRVTGHFNGTADAVYQQLDLIQQHKPDLVAVFAADHVYRMDVQQMVAFHRERDAEISVAAVPVPIERASSCGVIVTRPDSRVCEFQEKPERPAPISTDLGRAYASMGNYLFDPLILTELLEEANQKNAIDFGHHIMPHLPCKQRLFAYDFMCNRIPGVRPYEERGYWRDVGTHDALSAARNDVLGARPRFDLRNQSWPLRGASYRSQALGVRNIGLRDDDPCRRYGDDFSIPLRTSRKDVAIQPARVSRIPSWNNSPATR